MSETPRVGRNEPCPCGSGEKYKFCCEALTETPAVTRTSPLLVGAVILASAALAFVAVRAYLSPAPKAQATAPGANPASPPVQVTPGALPGDATSLLPSTAAPGTTPAAQPPGPAPPGKVWSPEHGHWHDDPAATPGLTTTLDGTSATL